MFVVSFVGCVLPVLSVIQVGIRNNCGDTINLLSRYLKLIRDTLFNQKGSITTKISILLTRFGIATCLLKMWFLAHVIKNDDQ